jgi:hypothetical protein
MEVTPSNRKPSNLYSSSHHLALERRNLKTCIRQNFSIHTSNFFQTLHVNHYDPRYNEWLGYSCSVLPSFHSWTGENPTSNGSLVNHYESNVYPYRQNNSTHPVYYLTHGCRYTENQSHKPKCFSKWLRVSNKLQPISFQKPRFIIALIFLEGAWFWFHHMPSNSYSSSDITDVVTKK